MSKYAAEQIGQDISHLYTNQRGKGLLAIHADHADRAIHLVELLPAIEKAYSKGEAGQEQAELVEREASGVEHEPLRIPWACDVSTRRVTYRYPHPTHRIEMAQATPTLDPMDNPLGQARVDNALVRLYRQVARALNETPRTPAKPRRTTANRPWMVGLPCRECGEQIYRDQPVMFRPGTGDVWCLTCPDPQDVVAL